MPRDPLIINTPAGLYCPAGDFHIDAWRPVARTIITHAHSDHARRGSERYLTAADGAIVLKRRMGADAVIDTKRFGETFDINGVKISLHPAGHVLGSSQVRLEHRDEVWVFTGDFKRQVDPTCTPFEPVRCNTFITESTFGLPIFRWRDPTIVASDINKWWRENVANERTSVILAYTLGKAQRVLASLDASIGPILLHGGVHGMVESYRQSGAHLPPAEYATVENAKLHRGRAIVIAPPGAMNSTWIRKFTPLAAGVASGWMQVRAFRKRSGADRGFILSDHADWPALMQTIDETRAEHVIVTHGYTSVLARYLREERGLRTAEFQTRFKAEGEDDDEAIPSEVSEHEAVH